MGVFDRFIPRLRGRAGAASLTVDTPGLRTVARAFDPAQADSAVLAAAAELRADEPAVLRHHLRLPADSVDSAAATLAADGWHVTTAEPDGQDGVLLLASRVQRLDAVHCAQERSRMAGLAQRLGGDALGWEALQPSPPDG